MKKYILRMTAFVCAIAMVLSVTAVTSFAAKADDSVTGDDSVVTGTATPGPTNDSKDDRYSVGLETKKPAENTKAPTDTKAPDDTKTPVTTPKATNDEFSDTSSMNEVPATTMAPVSESDEPFDNTDTIDNATDTSVKNAADASVKAEKETVKTGESDMVPIIVVLAVIAAVAGIGYAVYKNKKK